MLAQIFEFPLSFNINDLDEYRFNYYGLHAAIEAYKLELPEDVEVFKQENNILITELGIYIAVWKE